jgi:hypothetical protein
MFTGVTIRTYGDEASTRLYPEVNVDATGIVSIPEDGRDVDRVVAKQILVRHLNSDGKPLLKLDDVKIDVTITDGRVGIACPKYDKGGGWFGGPTALLLNAGSHMLAARRRRAKCLVGHLWYQWLIVVAYRERSGVLAPGSVRLVVEDGTVDTRDKLLIDLIFPGNVSTESVAREIVRRAAVRRLGSVDDLEDEDKAKLVSLADGHFPRAENPKKLSAVGLPGALTVRPSTAG